MDMPIAAHDIDYAEDLLAEGELDTARMLLEELAAEAGEYADTACIATEARQWFSFANPFERLAYRRVEQDPRELTQVDAPLDRLYAALAYVYVQKRDYELARDALKQAVRWNPMNCAHRLNLAEVYRALGDTREWAALSASVLERATTPQALARAFANLGHFFLSCDKLPAAEVAVGRRFARAPMTPPPRLSPRTLTVSIPNSPSSPMPMRTLRSRGRAWQPVPMPRSPCACSCAQRTRPMRATAMRPRASPCSPAIWSELRRVRPSFASFASLTRSFPTNREVSNYGRRICS